MVKHAPATLGSYTFLVDPVAVEWTFRMKMTEQHTIGGRVIQVYGTDLGDMVVRGNLGRGDASRGETEPWAAMERFLDTMEDLADETGESNGAVPLRFTVPSQDWSFDVYIKSVAPVTYSVEAPYPEFTMTLFIVEDITGKITKGVVDKYIERLAEGIGWTQSEYNGPTEEEVEAMLSPHSGSPGKAYKQALIDAFTNTLGAAGLGFMPGATGGGGGGAPVAGPEGINAFMWGLRQQESNQNYTARNPISTASGAYQYIDSTWGNYKGYARAYLAPPPIQDEKAAADISRFYATYKDWGIVAACWLTGHAVGPNGPNAHEWNRVPAPGNPTVREYVEGVLSKMAQAPV